MSDFAPSEAEQARIAEERNYERDWCDECEGSHVCHRCGGDGVEEYGGDPLNDFVDADPYRLVNCEDCGGSGDDERPWRRKATPVEGGR